jgi:hypothetical protein
MLSCRAAACVVWLRLICAALPADGEAGRAGGVDEGRARIGVIVVDNCGVAGAEAEGCAVPAFGIAAELGIVAAAALCCEAG